MTAKIVKKHLLFIAGTLSLILGAIGVFIPVLPTTPFLLLASFCYLRSSKSLYDWLIDHKLFGSYIYNYVMYKAVKKSTKIGAIIFLWISLGISFIIVQHMHIRVFLIFIGIAVSIHLFMLKTLSNKKK